VYIQNNSDNPTQTQRLSKEEIQEYEKKLAELLER
jgi:hypothetical protein